MAAGQSSSNWADDLSDDYQEAETRRLVNDNRGGYQSTHRDVIRDHEEGLDRLGDAIKRQRYIATELATEVDLHNEIIDDIDTGLTDANENLRKNTNNIKLVTKKSSTFFLWMLVIVLAAVIAALAII